jgi:hypothetical protein
LLLLSFFQVLLLVQVGVELNGGDISIIIADFGKVSSLRPEI